MIYYRKNNNKNLDVINRKLNTINNDIINMNNKIEIIDNFHLQNIRELYLKKFFPLYKNFKMLANKRYLIMTYYLSYNLENIILHLNMFISLFTTDERYKHQLVFYNVTIRNKDKNTVLYENSRQMKHDIEHFNHIYYINNIYNEIIVLELYLFHRYELYNNINFSLIDDESKIQMLIYKHNNNDK